MNNDGDTEMVEVPYVGPTGVGDGPNDIRAEDVETPKPQVGDVINLRQRAASFLERLADKSR